MQGPACNLGGGPSRTSAPRLLLPFLCTSFHAGLEILPIHMHVTSDSTRQVSDVSNNVHAELQSY